MDHLAAVRSDGMWTVHRHAIAAPSRTPRRAPHRRSGALSIASSPAGGERLIGAIDEIRVWTIARTDQPIAHDYTVSLMGRRCGESLDHAR
jgi:hypothetical protein